MNEGYGRLSAICVLLGLSFGVGYVTAKLTGKKAMNGECAEAGPQKLSDIDAQAAQYETMKKHLKLSYYDALVGPGGESHRVSRPADEEPKKEAATTVSTPENVKTAHLPSQSHIAERLAQVLGDETPESVRHTVDNSLPLTTGSPFAVQVASLPDKNAAQSLAERLKTKGYPAQIVQADLGAKGKVYRVRLHGYRSREDAEQAREAFDKKEQMNAITVQQ